ncbi:MAG: UDP-N-acetylmuramoyl-L-alanine--D-glutamate ligase [Tissierellia bacterium]|nr:UDP-N-acetylmuramoyl-L-alanine--D-glutamate ligase [Tissierellia bacterium]
MDKKRIIVFGLKITGISSAKALSHLGYDVLVYADKKDDDFYRALDELKDYGVKSLESINDLDFSQFSYLLKSPGIRLDNPLVKLARKNNLQVVSDVELAYRLFEDVKFIAITGTNGKTTTTHMVSSILTAANVKNMVVGNIGIGLLWQIVENGLDTVYVLEVSSFQLASSESFRSKIACLTNISPDHIDWHGSYEEYTKCKLQITANQKLTDTIIVNADDHSAGLVEAITKARIRRISSTKKLLEGSYCIDDYFYIDNEKSVISKSDINLVGRHNLENTLFATEVALALGISQEDIRKGIQALKPIEHRIEKVKTLDGVSYFNDSKGTNVDSTIKALDGFDNPIILIAGGYDKKADYTDLFKGRTNIKNVILFGQTKYDIKKVASSYGLQVDLCKDLEEAVRLSKKYGQKNDVVLFSPACASWDMYKNFEERGEHFKKIVNDL